MKATTFGLGPFHPAIRWYNNLWVAEAEYKTKDEAKDEALALVGALNKRAEECLAKLGYDPALPPRMGCFRIIEVQHRQGLAWAIQDEASGKFWLWCYKHKTFAELMSHQVNHKNAANMTEANKQHFAWRKNQDELEFSEQASLEE
ncbi:MAG TPA: hypothetical protein VGA05_08460 [Candidatus Bathyarchaeia archaeon]